VTLQAVARRYAGALFDVVQQSGDLDRAQRDLAAARALVSTNVDLARVLDNPGIPAAKKRGIVDALLGAGLDVSAPVARLLQMLADHDRLGALAALETAFNERVMRARHVQTGEVVSAVALGETRLKALAEALSKASGSQVTLTERVDPSIIGGFVARVGSVVFDGSVSHQLRRMRGRLLQDA